MPRLRARLLLLAALALGPLLSWSAGAHEYKLVELHIDHPLARASIGAAKAGAAYLTITNQGAEADRLVAVATPVARSAELHTHLMDDGVMKMRPVVAIEVAPGEPAVLQPGGLHIMLMGLSAPLQEGQSFPLTLTFEKAGTIEVEVEIEGATEMGPGKGMEHQNRGDGHSS
ncbi:MAG: copper chaperone PCu(A)C [Kiloniellales bacterium]